MLTETTTRREWLANLAESYARTAKHGGNTAILHHVLKVHNMLDAEWPAHRAELLARSACPDRKREIGRMAGELMELQS